MTSLEEVKLPMTTKEKIVDAQTRRLRALSVSLTNSNSEALNELAAFIDDVVEKLEDVTAIDNSDNAVSDDLQKAVSFAKQA